jgi:multidrug resistance efflux pump
MVTLYAWRLPPFSDAVITTENALVRSHVTLIGTQLAGYVTSVNVDDFEQVRAGQLLATIDDRSFLEKCAQAKAVLASQQAALRNWQQQRLSAQAGVERATAELNSAQAQAAKAEADMGRVDQLVGDGSLSLRERDASSASRSFARAGVAQAKAMLEIARQNLQAVIVNHDALRATVSGAAAALRAAQVDLDNTRIVAPSDGRLGQVAVRRGAYVNAGAQLMGVVPAQLWVIANYKETQMNRVRIGQPATVRVDALDGVLFRGRVERISPAAGSEFATLPADNATGNYVKIAQRIPVRISIDPRQAAIERLGPGMSVVVSIDTNGAPVQGGRP